MLCLDQGDDSDETAWMRDPYRQSCLTKIYQCILYKRLTITCTWLMHSIVRRYWLMSSMKRGLVIQKLSLHLLRWLISYNKLRIWLPLFGVIILIWPPNTLDPLSNRHHSRLTIDPLMSCGMVRLSHLIHLVLIHCFTTVPILDLLHRICTVMWRVVLRIDLVRLVAISLGVVVTGYSCWEASKHDQQYDQDDQQ